MEYDLTNYPLLEEKAEIEMVIKAKAGDKQAMDYLVTANIPLVKSLIKKWSNKGIETDDLFQVGCMGIMRAIKGYNESKGCKFSSYMYLWINNRMMRTIQNESRTIRLPVNAYQKNFNLIVATKKLEQELEKEPSIKELAEYTNKPIEEVKRFKLEILDTCSMNEITSLEGASIEKGSALPSNDNIENEVLTKLKSDEIMATIKNMVTEKEYKILCMRIGYGYSEAMTYDTISKEFGITKQRIQQVYRATTLRLKRSKQVRAFKCS